MAGIDVVAGAERITYGVIEAELRDVRRPELRGDKERGKGLRKRLRLLLYNLNGPALLVLNLNPNLSRDTACAQLKAHPLL